MSTDFQPIFGLDCNGLNQTFCYRLLPMCSRQWVVSKSRVRENQTYCNYAIQGWGSYIGTKPPTPQAGVLGMDLDLDFESLYCKFLSETVQQKTYGETVFFIEERFWGEWVNNDSFKGDFLNSGERCLLVIPWLLYHPSMSITTKSLRWESHLRPTMFGYANTR